MLNRERERKLSGTFWRQRRAAGNGQLATRNRQQSTGNGQSVSNGQRSLGGQAGGAKEKIAALVGSNEEQRATDS